MRVINDSSQGRRNGQMRVIILLVLTTSAGVFFSRQEEGSTPQGGLAWTRLVIYWLFTIMVSFEMVAGALWDLMKLEFVKAASAHLGYPEYMGTIIGVPRIPCALALLAPRFPRFKEWAYVRFRKVSHVCDEALNRSVVIHNSRSIFG